MAVLRLAARNPGEVALAQLLSAYGTNFLYLDIYLQVYSAAANQMGLISEQNAAQLSQTGHFLGSIGALLRLFTAPFFRDGIQGNIRSRLRIMRIE